MVETSKKTTAKKKYAKKAKNPITDRGKEKRVDDVEKVINTLPFLKTSTKTKKAPEDSQEETLRKQLKKKKVTRIAKRRRRKIRKRRYRGGGGGGGCEGRESKKPTKRIYPSCLTRSSPKAMSDAMVGLTEMRKKCLKDIGFERFINFPITELPGALLYYVVDKFHPTSMELRLEKGSIKIKKQRIHDMIGVTMGKTKLEDLEQRDPDDPFIAEWESQYSNVAKIPPAAISIEITSTFDVDFIFTINFLTLFASTMGTVDNGAKVFPTVLKHVKENDVISDIDWCGYILECLRTSRHNWEKVMKGGFYYGPATFLCLLYLDSTNFPQFQVMRHRPAMRSWNTQAMRKRIGMEIKENCLGKLEHHEEFDPEEEQTELVETLKEGMQKFKGDKTLFSLCRKYKKVFQVLDFDLDEGEGKKDEENGSDDGETDDDDSDDGSDDDDDKDKEDSQKMTKMTMAVVIRKKRMGKMKRIVVVKRRVVVRKRLKLTRQQKKQAPMIEKTAALETETPKNPKGTRNQVAEETKEEEEPAGKRTKKPSRYLVSPYMNKKTVINTPTKPDEMMVTNALFSMQGNPYEFMFQIEWAWGAATIRDNMQTLAPKLKVDASIIDSFACVLSYEETITNSGAKIKQYFHTGILTTAIVNAKKEDEEKQHKEFCANLKSVFKGNPEDNSMDHVELKKLFSRYLASHKHKKSSDIATKKTTLMKLKWGTKQNVIDCGVFVMMHMEQYGGETLKNCKFDFPKEGQDQELEIIRMRIKYATKMLMHELNIHREKINQETFEFASNNTDKALMQSMIREEIDKKQEEQAKDHVASAK
ncbi:hypothetical protein CTI12_AA221230 [Artemisia annua]|uniref:Ulp1 protease family, C-terminal catalytic domain-containing protein n=1 Tax=Artemisia annua TaxID=35608 RepID=A0A2U1NWR2_ARTAN|nr:hypothetical protein CTI12_AA221230 [Artemisia annua]